MKKSTARILVLSIAMMMIMQNAYATDEAGLELAKDTNETLVSEKAVVTLAPTQVPTPIPTEAPTKEPTPMPTDVPAEAPVATATATAIAQEKADVQKEVPVVTLTPIPTFFEEKLKMIDKELDLITATPEPIQSQEPTQTPPLEQVTQEPIPTEETAIEETPAPVPSGSVQIKVRAGGKLGQPVKLLAIVKGYEDYDYSLCWQYSMSPNANDEEWKNAPGANSNKIYTYKLDEDNANYYWRVKVTATY